MTPRGSCTSSPPTPGPTRWASGSTCWGKPLSKTQADGLKGKLKFFLDKKEYTGDPRKIVLTPHELITIEQGKVVEPPPFTFPPASRPLRT